MTGALSTTVNGVKLGLNTTELRVAALKTAKFCHMAVFYATANDILTCRM